MVSSQRKLANNFLNIIAENLIDLRCKIDVYCKRRIAFVDTVPIASGSSSLLCTWTKTKAGENSVWQKRRKKAIDKLLFPVMPELQRILLISLEIRIQWGLAFKSMSTDMTLEQHTDPVEDQSKFRCCEICPQTISVSTIVTIQDDARSGPSLRKS